MSGEKFKLLIVEDRDSLRRLLKKALEQEGHDVVAVGTVSEAIQLLEEQDFRMVLTDLMLPDASGLDVLDASQVSQPEIPVVVMTAFGDVSTAVKAMQQGAADFLEKPVELDDLAALVSRHCGTDSLAQESLGKRITDDLIIVGRHPRLRAAIRLLERVAPTDSTVLLTGESGTGKEVFARSIHELSNRHGGPFVAVNCAAIPESLIENELFGHEKGAFTGASRRQSGRFEQAEGGTLLLDEIGELDLGVQAKVLRVLEDRVFQRVGGSQPLKANVRVVAATNRDLKGMVEAGSFRSDLFFRLDVFPIELPPLRDRSSDIPLLCRHLLALVSARHGLANAPALTPDAEALLSEEDWPGNIRQLANVLERAVILADTPSLTRAALEPLVKPLAAQDDRQILISALEEAAGDKKKAAGLLGVSYRTLLRRVKEHDLEGYPHYH